MLKIILNFVFYTLLILAGITCAVIAAFTKFEDASACLLLISFISFISGILGFCISNDK